MLERRFGGVLISVPELAVVSDRAEIIGELCGRGANSAEDG